jgi:hypothetical protein
MERYREMNVRNYAWSDDEKKNLIAIGIMDIVLAILWAVVLISAF